MKYLRGKNKSFFIKHWSIYNYIIDLFRKAKNKEIIIDVLEISNNLNITNATLKSHLNYMVKNNILQTPINLNTFNYS